MMLGWDELSYDQSQEARGLGWKPRVRLRRSDEQSRMHECEIKDRSNAIWERRGWWGLFIVGKKVGEA